MLAVTALLCVAGMGVQGTASVDHAEERTFTELRPSMDLKEPGDACHGGHGSSATPVSPTPVPLHIPASDPGPPTFRPCGPLAIGGPTHDGASAVDLHRLQIQRT
ncbi:hypothetical protein D7319_25555 [Streptomyces radicis]|uniref:Uncharacterized protein n=1 Tax=Streptomyces radicis TaxID=1750517 RepID=A0A3A9VXY9_9ACTN|nr:hypothetical protein D7319_25555 [Streptomyces radicis]RKN16890.1 hypothetical protein D7318_24920 [Streptomyces radicis]